MLISATQQKESVLCIHVSSVQFSRSVVSNFLRPHEPQHARPPCPSPSPGVHPNPCPSSRWCHPTISSCCPLLLLPSIFPSIRVFSNESALRMRWPKYWRFSLNISPSKAYIPTFLDFPPIQVTTEHRVGFPVLDSRFSLVIYGDLVLKDEEFWSLVTQQWGHI